jgi:hypothetical protein
MRPFRRLSKALKVRRARQASVDGKMLQAPDMFADEDRIYTRPAFLPASIKEQGAHAVEAYLSEARAYYRGQFDSPYRSSLDMPVSMPTEDPLEEWDWQTRRDVLTNCHAAYHRNSIAKRAVDLTQQFAVGKGHTVAAQNADVQELIDDFRANPDNAIHEYERTLLRDLQIDGELFIRFFSENGETVIVPVPPWHIIEIDTDPEFFRRVNRYHLQFTRVTANSNTVPQQPTVDTWIPAEDMLHVPINNHSYELRGRPDLYVILPWLKAYKHWLEDRVRQNRWRGALLWWVQIAGAAAGTIAKKVNQWSTPPTSGSSYVSSDKETVTALQNSPGAPDVSEDGRQVRMMCATGVGLAEYMLGDGENANLASATAQQLPALWKFTDAQQLMAEMVWGPIYKRVIQNAVANGDLPDEVRVEDDEGDPVMQVDADGNETEQFIPATESFTVEYYEVLADDPKTMAEALAIDMSGGLVSVETARGQRGYDHNIEEKRLRKEEQDERDRVAQGTAVDVPPGGDGMDDEAEMGRNEQQEGLKVGR